jgi:hypothetical protein
LILASGADKLHILGREILQLFKDIWGQLNRTRVIAYFLLRRPSRYALATEAYMFVTGAFILHLLIADVASGDREMRFMAFSFDKGHSYS